MPGDRSDQAYEYSQTQGIPYTEGHVATLERVAQAVGIYFDLESLGLHEYQKLFSTND